MYKYVKYYILMKYLKTTLNYIKMLLLYSQLPEYLIYLHCLKLFLFDFLHKSVDIMCMYIHTHIYVCVCICVCVYIHIYIQLELNVYSHLYMVLNIFKFLTFTYTFHNLHYFISFLNHMYSSSVNWRYATFT